MPGESLLAPRGQVTPSLAPVHLQTPASKARLPPRTAASPRPPGNHVGTCPGTRRLKLFHGNVQNKQREEPGAPQGGGMGRAGRLSGQGRTRAVPRLQLWAEARPACRKAGGAGGHRLGGPGGDGALMRGRPPSPLNRPQLHGGSLEWEQTCQWHGGLEGVLSRSEKT